MLRRMFAQQRRAYKNIVDRRLSPLSLNAGDIYVVEYPKSGITWLTTLLANAHLYEMGIRTPATFSSVRRFVPDLHVSRATAPRLSKTGIGYYKSHSKFNSNYVNIIYLVRHPEAVMRSFYRYRKELQSSTSDYCQFIADPRVGLPAWRDHINSWFNPIHDTNQRFIHLVRYEDLLSDVSGTLNELNKNFSLGLSDAAIQFSITESRRDAMMESEEVYRRHNPSHSFKFVGSEAKLIDDETVLDMIKKSCHSELNLLGYKN